MSELLLDEGHVVIGVDNLNDSYDPRLKEWRLGRLRGRAGFQFHPTDISDLSSFHKEFELDFKEAGTIGNETGSDQRRTSGKEAPFDAVIHLAARSGVRKSVEDPRLYFDTNVTGTLNVLELCRAVGILKFVFASSSSLYGDDTPRPSMEDAETSRLLSPYAVSKKAAETLCYTYHHLYSLDVTVLRYFTVYGPAGRPDMSPFRFVQWVIEGWPVKLYGDGTQERDFTYVDDIAQGTIAALRTGGYEVINLGSSRPVSLNHFLGLVEELAGSKAIVENEPAQQADVMATWADIGKAKKLLGWQPSVSLRDGLTRLVEWYRQNRHWAKEIKT